MRAQRYLSKFFQKPVSSIFITTWSLLLATTCTFAIEYSQHQDVVFGYKDGMGLVMDVFTPKVKSKRIGIIVVMSGGMRSDPALSHFANEDEDIKNLLKAGYTIFVAALSSNPRYSIDEIRHDLPRAVRFIRFNANRFDIDPMHIGLIGYSSGGHMALLAATDPPEIDTKSWSPIDRQSSKVQAVVAFYPSTDNLNFGQQNVSIIEHFEAQNYKEARAAYDFRIWDINNAVFERVNDQETIRSYLRLTSPITHVSKDDPPILLFHGDKDKLVPLQQSQVLANKLREVGVPHKLVVVVGEGHGWDYPVNLQATEILNWFGKYLLEN